MFKGLKVKVQSDRLSTYIYHATNGIIEIITNNGNDLTDKQILTIFKEIWAYVVQSYLSVTSTEYGESFIREVIHKSYVSACKRVKGIDLLSFPESVRDEFYFEWYSDYESKRENDAELTLSSCCFQRINDYLGNESIKLRVSKSLGTIMAYLVQTKNAFNNWYE